MNFVGGLGNMWNGDAFSCGGGEVASEGVEKFRGRGGGTIPRLFDVVFSKKCVEQHTADSSLPQCYLRRPSKIEALVGSVFKNLTTKVKGRMGDTFASVHPVPPGSVIVSGAQSGDQQAQTDTWPAPHAAAPPRPTS